MLERTTTRTLPLVSRAVDLAPAAQACCGACRTCATTNVLGVAFAAGTPAALWLARLVQRSGAAFR